MGALGQRVDADGNPMGHGLRARLQAYFFGESQGDAFEHVVED